MPVTDIYNFIQIDDLTATAGQPSDAQFREAHEAGYEVVINLAPDGLETSLPNEDELLRSLGIDYYQISVAWQEPRLEQLREFEELMAVVAGRRVLIHCQANYRVTAFFALYAMSKLGWSEEQANALINRIWMANPDYRMDETWQSFVASARNRSARSDRQS